MILRGIIGAGPFTEATANTLFPIYLHQAMGSAAMGSSGTGLDAGRFSTVVAGH